MLQPSKSTGLRLHRNVLCVINGFRVGKYTVKQSIAGSMVAVPKLKLQGNREPEKRQERHGCIEEEPAKSLEYMVKE